MCTHATVSDPGALFVWGLRKHSGSLRESKLKNRPRLELVDEKGCSTISLVLQCSEFESVWLDIWRCRLPSPVLDASQHAQRSWVLPPSGKPHQAGV